MFRFRKMSKQKRQKYLITTSVSFLLLVLLFLLMAAWSNYTVTVDDNGNAVTLKTKQSTVGEVLAEAGITLGDFDKVEPAKGETVYNNMNIVISRAVLLSVTDGGTSIEYYSTAKTVEGVLNQTGYTLGEYDKTVPELTEPVQGGTEIKILRAKKYTVIDENGEREVMSAAQTVGEFAVENGLYDKEGVRLNLKNDVQLKEGMKIKVSQVEIRYEDVTEIVPYTEETVQTSSLQKGQTRVAQKGRNGIRVTTYEVEIKDGAETARYAVNTVTQEEAQKKIIEVGTGAGGENAVVKTSAAQSAPVQTKQASNSSANTSASSTGFSYSKVLVCTATGYDLSYESCGKKPGDSHYGITASGMRAQRGVVAVDPSVIPLGTKLYIEAEDGSWRYGYAVAGDTGGNIRGNRIDLFFDSRAEALQFGRKQARVYVLK